jgi:hypothetical protein
MLRQAEMADQADKIREQVPDHGVVRFTKAGVGRDLTYAAIRINDATPTGRAVPSERWYVTSGFTWESLLRFIGDEYLDTLEIVTHPAVEITRFEARTTEA